jgi:hypothetical protein
MCYRRPDGHFLGYFSIYMIFLNKKQFWDCKLYKDQRATMMDILPENSKNEYPKSVTELSRLEENDLFKAKFQNLFKKGKEVNIQNINSILFRVKLKSDVQKLRRDRSDRIRYL